MTTQTIYLKAKRQLDAAKKQMDVAKKQLLQEAAEGVIFSKLSISSHVRVGAVQFDLLGLSEERINAARKASYEVTTIRLTA